MTSDRQSWPPEFIAFLKMKEQQDQKANEAVIAFLKTKQLPTPNHIRAVINASVGQRPQLLRHHAFWEEYTLRLGLESLLRSAHQAYVDICRNDAALGSLANATDFERHVDHTVGYTAQKDLMAYCSLVFGVSDTLRRIKKRRADIEDRLWQITAGPFSSDVAKFLKDLRNNLSHGSVVIPQWHLSFQPSGPVGSMMYPKHALLQFGKWGASSKAYVTSITGDNLNIANAIGEHVGALIQFDREIQNLFARNKTPAERDFFDIEDSHKRFLRRQWISIFLDQAGNEKDPYDYLHRYFSPEEVREIQRQPHRSKEQIDFMIGLKGAEIECDEALKLKLYEKFGVVKT